MEVLGVEKALGIVIGLFLALTLITFGFRLYFKRRHFWGTYVLIALIGMISVAFYFLGMHWTAINPALSERYYEAFLFVSIFMALTALCGWLYYFYRRLVKKDDPQEVGDIAHVIDEIDSRVLVYDVLENLVNTFGKLKRLKPESVSFNTFQEFYKWQEAHKIEPEEKAHENKRIVAYEGAFLMTERSFIEDKNGKQVGQIIIIYDITEAQALINELEETNLALEAANSDFYRTIEEAIHIKKEEEKNQLLTQANKVLLDEMAGILALMDDVLEDSDIDIDQCHAAVEHMSARTEHIYSQLRHILNQLSISEVESKND